MAYEVVEVSLDGLLAIQSAAKDFAGTEIIRIAEAVIADLRSRRAIGCFDAIKARHMWDEYCWDAQEGPFDGGLDGATPGGLPDAWDGTVRAFVNGEVERLPKHALIFLSAFVFEEDDDFDEMASFGGIFVDGIVDTVMKEIKDRSSRPHLDLIGPHRGDVVGYEIEGSGMVWSALSDRREAIDLIAGHVDAMINADGDLSGPAEELVEAFMAAANEDAEDSVLAEFLERFGNDVRSLLLQKDVLPSLVDMRDALIKRLDG